MEGSLPQLALCPGCAVGGVGRNVCFHAQGKKKLFLVPLTATQFSQKMNPRRHNGLAGGLQALPRSGCPQPGELGTVPPPCPLLRDWRELGGSAPS